MNLNKIIDSLVLFQKYFHNKNGDHMCAEHDMIHVYPSDEPITPDDIETLRSYGWFQDCSFCSEERETGEQKYDPDTGWDVYT